LGRRSRSDLFRRFSLMGLLVLLPVMGWVIYLAVGHAYASPALQVNTISVTGLQHLTQAGVLARAGFVPGTSIFRLDLDQMRESIERLRWVRHARVQRVWPREIAISVIEREPIALARIDGQIFQVDDDGVILPLDSIGHTDSPVLDGLSLDDAEANRARIAIYHETVDLIGEEALSEVHITEAGEVSVVPSANPILVDLGFDQHLERWQRYLKLRARIQEDYPGAARVDLRYEDRVIIQPAGEQPARSVTWQEEVRLL
jgi:cell division protein FtsQ